jgi:hypothetical protein
MRNFLLMLLAIFFCVPCWAQTNESILQEEQKRFKSQIERVLNDQTTIEKCKRQAIENKSPSRVPAMCIRRRYDECILNEAAIRRDFCEPPIAPVQGTRIKR